MYKKGVRIIFRDRKRKECIVDMFMHVDLL